ncbi:hypothetical protein [Pseudobacteriovorax antillogorgiicola]|uniref:Uncharacterized protein n=1 Tax=Pseudobacteriovorax antillogorgiicola TaxID=1513793 RepID=A0A1Y6B3G8_9BACT|nr:hypothetical protein [Pseudobacteriovorax antillogorgiicola]TCS59308.1 hypothetical protein EDD56_101215 [Pseudobacteriovorax antillogorgiicola]SME89546.1 hypothetical protein SAMN06296036_101271 [Pseudobacteriovorax antillogorgiicola]
MDVLQYLKTWNQEVIGLAGELLNASPDTREQKWTALKREILSRSALDKNYLLPEVLELSHQGSYLASLAQDSLDKLETMIRDIELIGSSRIDGVEKAFAPLLAALTSYTELMAEKVMPLIRAKMSTSDREDLYELFQDVSGEPDFYEQAMQA